MRFPRAGKEYDPSLMNRILDLIDRAIPDPIGPSQIVIANLTGQPTSSVRTSSTVTLEGPSSQVWGACIRGEGTPELQINGGSWVKETSCRNGDTIAIRLTSSGSAGVTRTAVLYFPNRTVVWTVST